MKLTVVTATYNVETLLAATLDSIVGQTYADLELIIVDGGSTDGTLAIARQYEGPKVRLISEPDKGIYDAMNKGVGLASGAFVNFMNAGDAFADDAIVAEMAKALAGDEIDYAYGNVISVFGVEEKHSVARPPDFIWRNKPFNHQSLFARRSWLQRFPFDLRYRLVADYDQTYAAYRAGAKLLHLPLTIARVDMSDGASKRSYFSTVREKVTVNWVRADNKLKVLAYLALNIPYLLLIYLLRVTGLFNVLMGLMGRNQKNTSA